MTTSPINGHAQPNPQQSRGRQSAAPLCPTHQQPCIAGHSSAAFTYYYCRDADCKYSEKVLRPKRG